MVPKYSDIPDEFKKGKHKWQKLIITWFFRGIKIIEKTPKSGVDANQALRHVGFILRGFALAHEHKEAACAFLLSEWFEDIKYE